MPTDFSLRKEADGFFLERRSVFANRKELAAGRRAGVGPKGESSSHPCRTRVRRTRQPSTDSLPVGTQSTNIRLIHRRVSDSPAFPRQAKQPCKKFPHDSKITLDGSNHIRVGQTQRRPHRHEVKDSSSICTKNEADNQNTNLR